jgi:hypothetical protein
LIMTLYQTQNSALLLKSVSVVQSTLFSQAIHEQANNTFCE